MPTPQKGAGGKFVKKAAEPEPAPSTEPEPEQPSAEEVAEAASIVNPETGAGSATGGNINDRCPVVNDQTGQQCLYVIHAADYPHLFNLDAGPALANPEARQGAAVVPVAKVKEHGEDTTWWCGRCGNAQLMNNKAACAKCGAIPEFA